MKAIKIIFISILIIMLSLLAYHYRCLIINGFKNHVMEWLTIIITTAIGGTIGALLSYRYVMHIEGKREIRIEEKERSKEERKDKDVCAKALLSAQMSLLLQMEVIKSLEFIIDNILNFYINGTTIWQVVSTADSVSKRAEVLFEKISKDGVSLERLTPVLDYIILDPVADRIVALPHEIYSALNVPIVKNNITISDMSSYFREISSCNRKYMNVITSIMRSNDRRDSTMNNIFLKGGGATPIEEVPYDFLYLIAGMVTLADKTRKLIEDYFKKSKTVLDQTENYIKLLDIPGAIFMDRDKEGNAIFDRVDSR